MLVQANTIGNLINYIMYQIWIQMCSPIVGTLAFFTALFFGDYVTAFYNGLEFCEGSFLDSAKNML